MTSQRGKVLILGADGFIGRHLAFGLREAGWQVLASARRTARLQRMGFETFEADLIDPNAHHPEYWRDVVRDVSHIVNAAGVLNAPDATYTAVHVNAPKAVYKAMSKAQGILISAVGIEGSETAFARYRLAGEEVATAHNITVLRAGLVLADTSYGGSSLARALAALPFTTPVVGDGQQKFNPIHASDLASAVDELLRESPSDGIHEIGGPETVTQQDMALALRSWLGLPKARALHLPERVARWIGRVGDAMRWGPISTTAVAQLGNGVFAKTGSATADLDHPPRGFSQFLRARPAGTQDLWHARLYLFRPLLRMVLGILWLISGMLGLLLPSQSFLPLIETSAFSDSALVAMARLGGIFDLGIAYALFRGWRPRFMAGIQALMVLGYTLTFAFLAPALWLLPLGGLLKNMPILALIAVTAILEDER